MKRLFAISIAALAVGVAAPVLAQDVYTTPEVVISGEYVPAGAEVRAETVSFADLNVARPEGAHVLFRRIEAAAHDVCQPAASPVDLQQVSDYSRCYRHAIDRAVYVLDNPLVTADRENES